VKVNIVMIMATFRPMMSLNLVHIIMNPISRLASPIEVLFAIEYALHTGVGDQISSHYPVGFLEFVQVMGDSHQRSADDCDFQVYEI
jgi:hypothetical protein